VPNLYPALERQEVVVHSPRHVRSFAELSNEEVEAVAGTWHQRSEEAWVSGFSYVHAAINEGRLAGASLAHSHSQLIWLRDVPPVVREEQALLDGSPCALCDLLASERADGARVIAEHDGVLMSAAYAGRAPYELLIAGEHWGGQPGFDGGVALVRALELMADGLRRIRTIEGPIPVNVWLHNSGHWHLEVLPRLTQFAGLELGAGIYVNVLPPEEAARALREAG